MKPALFGILFLLVISPGSGVQEAGNELSLYDRYYAEGNQLKEFDYLSGYILKNPVAPESAVYAQMIASMYNIKGYDAIVHVLDEYAGLVEKSGSSDKNEILSSLYFTQQNLREMFVHQGKRNNHFTYIDKWKVSGRFVKYGYADLNVQFDPEKNPDFKNRNITSSLYNYVDLNENVYPQSGIYYFKSSFVSDREIYLVIESSDYYKIFINGKEAGTNFYQNTYRNRRIFSVKGSGEYTVLIKFFAEPDSGFRASVLKNDFTSADIKYTETSPATGADIAEHLMYPHDKLVSAGSSGFALAKYFYFLGSSEFQNHYDVYLKSSSSGAAKTLYGSDLVDFHSVFSAKSAYGWKILTSVWQKPHPPVPALFYKFQQKLEDGNIQDAFKIVAEIRSGSDYYPLEYAVLNFYHTKGYEKQFFNQYERIRKLFPDSYAADIYKMDFYHGRNNSISEKTGTELLKKIISTKVLRNLLFQYKSTGRYDEALDCLNKAVLSDFNKNMETGKILILQKKYGEAKRIFLSLLAQNETPEILYYLGDIEVSEKRSADLYWGKLYSLEPEFVFPQDYLAYSAENRLSSEFEKYRNADYVDSEIEKFQNNLFYYPSSTVYRGEIVRLYENNTCRYFHEELLFIKNDSEVSSKGEYRIPVTSNYEIIKAEVINRDGSVSASYKKNKTADGLFISINGIRKNSLVHVIYEINNYDFTWYKSSFLASNYIRLQGFRESASKIEVKVITEMDKLVLYNNRNVPVKTARDGNLNVYSFELNGLHEIENEYYTGDSRRNMPSFGFTNITSADDLIRWYSGYFPEFKDLDFGSELKISPETDVSSKIEAVYNFVSRKISTNGNFYFYPADPEDILFLKKGTVEDKVFLARQMLHQLGIESFPALVRDDNLMKENIYFKDSLNGILLYVPSVKMWLDFSSEYYPAGNVDEFYENNTALVVGPEEIRRVKVSGIAESSSVITADIDMTDPGETFFSIKTLYSGVSNYLRYYFKDERMHSTMVSALSAMDNPGLITDSFSVSRLNDYSVPFSIESKGSILGFSLQSPDSLSFNPFIMKTGFLNYLYDNERNFDLVIDQNELSEETYFYKLESGYGDTVISVNKVLSYGNSSVSYSIEKEKNSNIIKVTKKTEFRKQVVPAAEFEKFKNFALSVREMDNYRILLDKRN
ncbi:MAG: hypothetical protein JW982_01370 [Spirochaetes bacterium]|nr:hypothetical protein [Spirochaetota bacterium]